MTNLRILLITAEYSHSVSGGAGVYARHYAETLSKAGVYVHVLTSGVSNETQNVNSNLTIEKIKTIYIPVVRTPLFLLNVRRRLKSLISQYDIHFIHGNNTAAAWIDSKLPMITTLHHPVTMENENFSLPQRILNLLDTYNEKILMRKSQRVITTSKQSHDIFKTLYPSLEHKLVLIKIGVDTEFFRPVKNARASIKKLYSLDKSTKIVFVPGAARAKRKGLECLLEAINFLDETDTKYIISGATRELNWKAYKSKGTSYRQKLSKVIFTGELEYKDLPTYYSAADFVVFPSLFEGFGLPTLESLSCGIPVISTNTGEAEAIVDKTNGILVTPNDQISLKNSIQQFLSDPALLNKLSQNARKSVLSRYSWKHIGEQYIKLYEKL